MNEQLLLISSDPSAGATNKSSDGSSFDLQFDTPLELTGNPTMKVISANAWYVFPNVKTGVNDKITIRYGTSDVGVITIPQGLYDIDLLNNAIEREIQQTAIADGVGNDSLTFVADNATQKVTLEIRSTINIEIRWGDTSETTMGALFGFNAITSYNTVTHGNSHHFEGANQAQMSPLNSLQLHCSAARGSIANGKSGSSTIAAIEIDASPGHQILYRPFFAPKVSASSLKSKTSVMRFSLTDQSGNPVNTQGEYYQAQLLLEW